MKPVAWMDDGTTRAGSEATSFRVVHADTKATMPRASRDNFTVPLVTLSAANAAIEERDKRIAELEDEVKREASLATSMAEDRNAAEARAEAAEADNARHLAEIDRKSSMPGDYRYWECRYRDEAARAASLEAMVVEAGKALEPFASGKHEMRNTHLLEWLAEGFTHCKYGSEEWAQSYLNSAMDYITAFEDAARSIAAKIGGRNE